MRVKLAGAWEKLHQPEVCRNQAPVLTIPPGQYTLLNMTPLGCPSELGSRLGSEINTAGLRWSLRHLACVWATVCLAAMAAGQEYSFTTIIGSPGQSGGLDGQGNAALLRSPSGLALSTNGDLFIADTLNHVVRLAQWSGTAWNVSTIAGAVGATGADDGVGTEARFNRPTGLAIDEQGAVLVVDRYNHMIRKLTREGTNWVATTIAGKAGERGWDDGVGATARFSLPGSITPGAGGVFYVADIVNSTIRLLEPIGTEWAVSTVAGFPEYAGFVDGAGADAEFFYPYALATDGSGDLLVTDAGNHAIRRVSGLGTDYMVSTVSGISGASGSLDGPADQARFYFPNGIATGPDGAVFICDQSNHTIRKLANGASGLMVSTVGGTALQSGTNDGTGTTARFRSPYGIAVDAIGRLFIADYGNHTIRLGTPVAKPEGPRLATGAQGGLLTVSWPATDGYELEQTPRLDAPAWTKVTEGIVLSGGVYRFETPMTEASAFYRLARP